MRIAGTLAFGAACALGAIAAKADQPLTSDATRGEQVYERCGGCHSLDANRVGPMHRGVYGRTAGSVPDFTYSAALKSSGIVWDETTLDQWLSGPSKFVPGSKMGFKLGKAQERADVIAYLKQESGK